MVFSKTSGRYIESFFVKKGSKKSDKQNSYIFQVPTTVI